MKRLFCVVLMIVMIASVCVTSVLAGYTHNHDTIVQSCSHADYQYRYVNCPWQGHYGGGEMHTAYCQIHQTWRFNTINCSTYGCRFSHTADPDYIHLCDAYHTGANMSVHVCPFS